MLSTAIILAGGFGTRLQKVVNDLPKPMAPVNDRPFLNYQLKYLQHYGIKNVVFSTGHLAEKISDHYHSKFENLNISYVKENTPLGTGGGIRLAIEQVKDEEVLVLNGDSFFDIDLKNYFELHQKNKSSISLALRKVEDASRYGCIELNEESRITAFKEKSSIQAPGIINAGVYILNKETYLKHTPPSQNFSIEKDFFEKHINTLKITGFKFEAYFIDIGIPEDYEQAQNDFKGFKY